MKTYNSDKWNEWMLASLNGDQSSYRQLLNSTQQWLSSYYKKRVPLNMVDDLVQDCLMRLHSKRHTYDPQYHVGVWLAAIARYRLIDYWRKQKKYSEVELPEDGNLPEALWLREPEAHNLAGRDVELLLKNISPYQSLVIKMVKLNQMSIQDAASATGYSIAAVKVMIHRGLKKMMQTIKK